MTTLDDGLSAIDAANADLSVLKRRFQIPARMLLLGLPGVIVGYSLRSVVSLPVSVGLLRREAKAPAAPLRARLRRFGGWAWISSLIVIVSWSRIELVFLERIFLCDFAHTLAPLRVNVTPVV